MTGHIRRRFALSLLIVGTPAGTTAQQRPCDDPAPPGPSRDLYCIELIPAPGFTGVSGRVELGHLPGPFTVAVGPDGRPRSQLILSVAGLPAAGSLGDYRSYVAWVAPPSLDSVVLLGVVRNGRTTLGVVELEKFVVLITAEQGGQVKEPSDRVVLRGQSPATRLFPPDLTQFSLGRMRQPAPRGRGRPLGHDSMHSPAPVGSDSSSAWTGVPMLPGLTMLPSEAELRPGAAPWLPSGDAPLVRPSERIRVRNGDTLRLEAGKVRTTLPGHPATMFAFNGQHPGPLIEVAKGSEITVLFRNSLPQSSSVHWHGIRLDNRSDGTPGMTQPAVPSGGVFTYRLRFPDPGIYWYHPHVREDTQQELGLYGNLLVRPGKRADYGPVNREAILLLDDILVNDSALVPLGRESTTHALMGRFGNMLLVNGEPQYRLKVRRGEVVRFYLTNAANARTLNLSFAGSRMKLVGSDVGNYEREELVENVVIAPAERYIVLVRFDRPGTVALVNRVRALDHVYGRFFDQTDTLGLVSVVEEPVEPDLRHQFAKLQTNPSVQAEFSRFRRMAVGAPQKTLILTLETRELPFLTQRLMQLDSIYFAPVEWSGTMPMMNWASTGTQVRWILRDPETGRENMDIDWGFRRGEPVRIRLLNQRQSIHAMQHPIHLHGQRFLILSVNGVPSRNLVWKDTVLVPAGGAVDILLDPSNPGRWMAHCHIAEHLSAGMMLPFTVD